MHNTHYISFSHPLTQKFHICIYNNFLMYLFVCLCLLILCAHAFTMVYVGNWEDNYFKSVFTFYLFEDGFLISAKLYTSSQLTHYLWTNFPAFSTHFTLGVLGLQMYTNKFGSLWVWGLSWVVRLIQLLLLFYDPPPGIKSVYELPFYKSYTAVSGEVCL